MIEVSNRLHTVKEYYFSKIENGILVEYKKYKERNINEDNLRELT